MVWFGFNKKKQVSKVEPPLIVGESPTIDGLMGMAREKTMGEMERSLITAKKENRLVFHNGNDGGVTNYTDRKGNHGVYDDDQLATKLWQVFDDKFSEVQYGGITAGLVMLGITELDILDIIKKVRGN